jgi:hypothetical protein
VNLAMLPYFARFLLTLAESGLMLGNVSFD